LTARSPRLSPAPVLVVATLALFCLAPTPGDIGGCGQPAEELDPVAFFEVKKYVDCQACQRCGIETAACSKACGAGASERAFPTGCAPLAHDGEVCLRALDAADCDDYASYLSDAVPRSPSECQFCPVRLASLLARLVAARGLRPCSWCLWCYPYRDVQLYVIVF